MARAAGAAAIAAAELAETGVMALAARQENAVTPLAYYLGRIASYNTFVALIAPALAEAAVLRFPQFSLFGIYKDKTGIFNRTTKSIQFYLLSIPYLYDSG